jgi:hypothetical protein
MTKETTAMVTRQDKSNADIAFGEIRNGSYIAGFSREGAVRKLEWLLNTDLWRLCGTGYSDINAFLHDIWREGETFRLGASERKKLALRIKELQAEASNRAIGRALGADERTIRRDLSDAAAHAAEGEIKAKQIKGERARAMGTSWRRPSSKAGEARKEKGFRILDA